MPLFFDEVTTFHEVLSTHLQLVNITSLLVLTISAGGTAHLLDLHLKKEAFVQLESKQTQTFNYGMQSTGEPIWPFANLNGN